MSFKTISIAVLAILLTVVIMQNNEEMSFKLLFTEVLVSKLVVMLACFIVGILIGAVLFRSRSKHTPINDANKAYLDLES